MTPEQIFHAHNVGDLPAEYGCQCAVCVAYRASLSGPEAKPDPLQQFLSDLDAAIQQMKGQQ